MTPTTFAIAEDAVVDEQDEELPVDEPEDDEEEVTEVPVHGVLAPEGVPTGDGRQFAPGALSHRELPLPIAYQIMSAEGHMNAVTVGRIDNIERADDGMRFTGALMTNRQYTPEVIEGIIDGTVRGISVDVDNVVLAMSEDDNPDPEFMEFAEARIAGVTIVPIPAFQEAFIALGHEFLADIPDEGKEALAACGCEQGPEDDDNPDIEMGYDVYDVSGDELLNWNANAQAEDGAYRNYDAAQRKKMAETGKALPDGSFPILDEEDLRNAIQAIGRASDPDAAKAHIKKRARALGHEELIPEGWSTSTDEFAPGTKDGPGWITHPVPTARIRRYWVRGKGAAKIRWGQPGDFNRCRKQLAKYVANPEWLAGTCANMHYEALGFWPSTHRRLTRGSLAASGDPAPMFTLVAAVDHEYPAEWFQRVELSEAEGLVIDGDRIYGYIATWGVCHIGIPGICTTAPQSASNYAYFATGVINTDDGGQVRVGQITMDTGHASIKANAKVAASHYDNTGSVVADVAAGEDATGIWFAGVLRPGITDEQRRALAASGRLSGDWRTIGNRLELVAALAVNVPGFPIPKVLAASGESGQTALVAAGVAVPNSAPAALSAGGVVKMDADEIAGIVRTAVVEYMSETKKQERLIPLRAMARDKAVRALREKIRE